jgi:hypothetical protein
MSLTTCRCGQVFAHLPLPGEARSAECLPCVAQRSESPLRQGTGQEHTIRRRLRLAERLKLA